MPTIGKKMFHIKDGNKNWESKLISYDGSLIPMLATILKLTEEQAKDIMCSDNNKVAWYTSESGRTTILQEGPPNIRRYFYHVEDKHLFWIYNNPEGGALQKEWESDSELDLDGLKAEYCDHEGFPETRMVWIDLKWVLDD